MDRGAKAAGVKRIRIHDLRHSYISLLIDMGFSAVAIADRVGQKPLEKHYSRVSGIARRKWPHQQGSCLIRVAKEEYCYRRCLNQDVVVESIQGTQNGTCRCPHRIEAGNSVDEELLNVIELIAVILGGLKGEDTDGK